MECSQDLPLPEDLPLVETREAERAQGVGAKAPRDVPDVAFGCMHVLNDGTWVMLVCIILRQQVLSNGFARAH